MGRGGQPLLAAEMYLGPVACAYYPSIRIAFGSLRIYSMHKSLRRGYWTQVP